MRLVIIIVSNPINLQIRQKNLLMNQLSEPITHPPASVQRKTVYKKQMSPLNSVHFHPFTHIVILMVRTVSILIRWYLVE